MNRLQPWTTDAWNILAWNRQLDLSQGWFHKRSQYYVKQAGNPDRALMHCQITSTIIGPLAFQRLVTLTTSNRTVQLHLSTGLALGTGMPQWLRTAQLVENAQNLGTLIINAKTVNYQSHHQTSPPLIWNLDLPLLKYTGPDQALGYGTIQLAESQCTIAQLLVPRMNSATPRLDRKYPLIRQLDPQKLNADLENGLLGLLALAVFCLDVATQWQVTMTENHPGTMPN